MAMNPNAKALWVEALRSGKYQQARGKLMRKVATVREVTEQYGYCCLGVLCEVAKENGVELSDDVLARYNFPSQEVLDWAGLDICDPILADESGVNHNASGWNDDEHASFAEIADMIERSL